MMSSVSLLNILKAQIEIILCGADPCMLRVSNFSLSLSLTSTNKMSTKVKVYVTEHHIDKETSDIPILSFESVVKDDLWNVSSSVFSLSDS